MTYEQFIATLLKHQTYHVKALSFPESCSPKKIPDSVLTLFPAIIKILEKQVAKLCQLNQIIAVFGLQTAPIAINSSLPIISHRIIDRKQPKRHLCCSLSYMVSSANDFANIKSWKETENIILDFTTGEIMDGNYYMTKLSHRPAVKGHLYGVLDSSELNAVWKNLSVDLEISPQH